MKKIIYILSFISMTFGVFSCDQNINYPYEGKDRVHFKFFDLDFNNKRTEYKSMTQSLGLLNDTIEYDTLKVTMELLGRISEVARKYKVAIVADSTTAKEGIHYKPFDNIQSFRSGKTTDTLRIVINRNEFSSNYYEPKDEVLYLKIEATEDFDLGLSGGCRMKIILNNYLTKPKWWDTNFQGELYFFHPTKWKILMSFDKEFATYGTVSFDRNSSKGKEYSRGLRQYLNEIPTYDEYTGDRIYIDKLVPQN